MRPDEPKLKFPETCSDCDHYECYPHPHKGWTDVCGLIGHCIDDDQPEEWIYDGGSRVKACPLIEVNDDSLQR